MGQLWAATGMALFAWGIHFVVPSAPVAFADGEVVPQVSAACGVLDVTSTHKAASSDYTVTGSCSVLETSFGRSRPVEAYAINWTATASHQPNTKATFETMTITVFVDGKITDTGSVNSTMQCGKDPWRIAPSGPCRLVTRKTSPPSFAGYVSMAYQKMLQDAPGLPLSFALNPAQRAAVEKQYQIAMATQQPFDPSMTRRQEPRGAATGPFIPGGTPSNSDALLVRQTPRILSPLPGATVVQGQLVVKATPAQVGATAVMDLEFTWLDTPPNQNRYVNLFPAQDAAKLAQGLPIPVGVTRGQPGRWEIRARTSGSGTNSPWSAPVPFQLVLTSPPQSQT